MRSEVRSGRTSARRSDVHKGGGWCDAASRELQASLGHPDARVWMAFTAFSVVVMAGLIALFSYDRKPLNQQQITTILIEQPQEIRRRVLVDLRDDYGIQTLGEPITRGRIRDAIESAKDEVEYDRLLAEREKVSAATESTLDTVSRSVEHAK